MRNFHSRKGQSLVEALVALSILTTALLGIETLLTRSFLLDRVTVDQTKATYLASEGIEIMKNLIDHQVYDAATGGWSNFCNFSSGSNTYEVDYTTTSCPLPTPVSDAVYIPFNGSTGLYSYGDVAAKSSSFKRIITITKPAGDPNVIIVQSTIKWSTGSVTGQTLTLEDHFYNWNPKK